jgi:hypothetical protein
MAAAAAADAALAASNAALAHAMLFPAFAEL